MVDENAISLDDLDLVKNFMYLYHDRKNKPEAISPLFVTGNCSLKNTASQAFCLLKTLPLILGSTIPEGNEDWEVFLLFREITDIIFADDIPAHCICYLEVQIQNFLTAFTQKYPAVPITPKLHYMVHYPRLIREFGPLRRFWTMRFEGKHQYFKSLASRVKNFRNICRTLAQRHHLLQSYILEDMTLEDGLYVNTTKLVSCDDLPPCMQHFQTQSVWQVSQASIDKCSYRVGDVLVLRKGTPPVFDLVTAMYVASSTLFIVADKHEVLHFDRHKFACCLGNTREQIVIHPGEEAVPYALDLYPNGFVVPKWEIF
ncbi:uncharacterized protein LOC135388048 [Ornithodoros turicata]|uniref:uncharacterized protein LOC135388048 n=1 Tax=Ornithodoros turicata TaxID=34597 RepID=UPI0031388877